jgi:hypothetical protein
MINFHSPLNRKGINTVKPELATTVYEFKFRCHDIKVPLNNDHLSTTATKMELGKAPWSSGECCGLTTRAMVLGHGFESQLCLKLDGNDGPLDGRKANENNT